MLASLELDTHGPTCVGGAERPLDEELVEMWRDSNRFCNTEGSMFYWIILVSGRDQLVKDLLWIGIDQKINNKINI